jgi:hypothetical protein
VKIFLLILFLVLTTTSYAQTEQNISIELNSIDIRSAIETIFKNSGKNFAISADVQGTTGTISFTNVPFDTALRNLLSSSNLVYRIIDEIYQISTKSQKISTNLLAIPLVEISPIIETTTTKDIIIDKISLNYLSPSEILALLGNSGNNGSAHNNIGGSSLTGSWSGLNNGFGNSNSGSSFSRNNNSGNSSNYRQNFGNNSSGNNSYNSNRNSGFSSSLSRGNTGYNDLSSGIGLSGNLGY